MKKITQAEARRLRKRVTELENVASSNARHWASDWVGGSNIAWSSPSETVLTAIRTARLLGYYVIVLPEGEKVRYYAVKP